MITQMRQVVAERCRRGMSVKEAARLSGLSIPTIYQFDRYAREGRASVWLSTLEAYAHAVGLAVTLTSEQAEAAQ